MQKMINLLTQSDRIDCVVELAAGQVFERNRHANACPTLNEAWFQFTEELHLLAGSAAEPSTISGRMYWGLEYTTL